MTFTTLTFMIFLLVVFTLYWVFPNRKAQNLLILVSSYVFYGWWDYRLCSLLLASSLLDFSVGLGMEKAKTRRTRRALLWISLAGNLGMLGTFKYFDFFAESLAALAARFGVELDPITLRLVLPVGISFYTFQTLSYTIDIYRGFLRPTRAIVDYLSYVVFFPQLVAGPIERAGHLLPQFLKARSFDERRARDGARLILWGFFKKLVIADNMGAIVNSIYDAPADQSGPRLMFATVCFAYQIYCDFSAYSDIAIGTGRLFGFELMRNFAYPYFARNLSEFWRRWHISLSTWFRDYVYIPLGGSRGGRVRRVVNVLITFLVSGFWHGASWNFVIWGGLHGLAVLPSALFRRGGVARASDMPGGPRLWPSPGTFFAMVATFAVTCLAWVFFRARTLTDAVLILSSMWRDLFQGAAYAALGREIYSEWMVPVGLMAGLVVTEWVQRHRECPLHVPAWPRVLRWGTYTAVMWLTLYWCAEEGADFIYFQF